MDLFIYVYDLRSFKAYESRECVGSWQHYEGRGGGALSAAPSDVPRELEFSPFYSHRRYYFKFLGAKLHFHIQFVISLEVFCNSVSYYSDWHVQVIFYNYSRILTFLK